MTIKLGNNTVTYDGSAVRTITVPDIVDTKTVTAPAYTNKIPMSLDTSGAVFNGTGYKAGVYLNSAGAELSGTGVATSGFIPVKKGDVIRIKDTSQANIDTSLILALTAQRTGVANAGKRLPTFRAIRYMAASR